MVFDAPAPLAWRVILDTLAVRCTIIRKRKDKRLSDFSVRKNMIVSVFWGLG